jgi:hypothetical protein
MVIIRYVQRVFSPVLSQNSAQCLLEFSFCWERDHDRIQPGNINTSRKVTISGKYDVFFGQFINDLRVSFRVCAINNISILTFCT